MSTHIVRNDFEMNHDGETATIGERWRITGAQSPAELMAAVPDIGSEHPDYSGAYLAWLQVKAVGTGCTLADARLRWDWAAQEP